MVLSLDTDLRFDDVLELNTHHAQVLCGAVPISLCRERGDCETICQQPN